MSCVSIKRALLALGGGDRWVARWQRPQDPKKGGVPNLKGGAGTRRRGAGAVRGREPERAWARARRHRSSKGRGSKRVGLAVPASVSPADYCPNAGSPSAGDLSVAGERGGWRLARDRK